MHIINAEVDYEAFLYKFNAKADQIPSRLSGAINKSALDGQGIVKINAPVGVGTASPGNLRSATDVENRGLLERVIFPNIDKAYYALFVILGHLTRPFKKTHGQQRWVKGNDYFGKSMPQVRNVVEKNLKEFTDWLAE